MTLNVTVLTPMAIYQSSDFRLVNSRDGQMMSNRSPKSVELTFETWSGIVTYTGLGEWDGRDVSQHIEGWLSRNPKLTMPEVAEIVATETTKLLDEVSRERSIPRFAHTVTLVGFVDGRAHVSVISNSEDGSGKVRQAVDATMTISTRQLRRGERARVLVTGRSKAVTRAERRAIKRLAEKHPSDGVRIRARLEELNERAAANEPLFISKDCAVASLRADGRGMLQLNRGGENPAWFPSVSTGGFPAAELLRRTFDHLGLDRSRLQVVGYGRATFRPGEEAPPDAPCERTIVTPDSAAGYELVEIASEEVEVLYPGGQNEDGIVVGTARGEPNTAADIPWVWDGSEIGGLDFAGSAVAINGEHEVAGTREPETGLLIARDGEIHDLAHYHGAPGVFAGSGSLVRAINDHGEVAGSAHSAAEEQGHPNLRPALFQLKEPTLVAMDVPSGEGKQRDRHQQRRNGAGLVQPGGLHFTSDPLGTTSGHLEIRRARAGQRDPAKPAGGRHGPRDDAG